jgi:hypothetical protein
MSSLSLFAQATTPHRNISALAGQFAFCLLSEVFKNETHLVKSPIHCAVQQKNG